MFGSFQSVTVNLFDLSLCKSLQRIRALLQIQKDGGRKELLFCPGIFVCLIFFDRLSMKILGGHID